jgi:class 3 adenylate cyclase
MMSTEAGSVLELPENIDSLDLGALIAFWRAHDPDRALQTPAAYRRLGERILRLGEPLLASDVLAEGLKRHIGDVRLRQLQGLALARAGAIKRANEILARLDHEGHSDEETLGLLARTCKDLGMRAVDPAERTTQLTRAFDAYGRAYRLSRGYWSGINAATLAVVLGDQETAGVIAREVRESCHLLLSDARAAETDLYWILATLGEAALILNDWAQAEMWYGRAAAEGRGRLGEIGSTRRNARLLLEHVGGDRARIDRCFQMPRVVVFAGHMTDRPDRPHARFPPELEGAVRDAIAESLRRVDGRLGFSSAARGSDILFLETVLALGGEVNVVLPYGSEEFAADTADGIPDASWRARYWAVLGRATRVVTASSDRLASQGISLEYANLLLSGLASVRAEQLDAEIIPMAVWDGQPGDGPGGTASLIEMWQGRGLPVEVIDLRAILRRQCPGAVIGPPVPVPPTDRVASGLAPRIMAVLFADAVHFSRLTEAEIACFVDGFLRTIADLLDRPPHRPVMRNTWGDGFFFVFSSVRAAGCLALDLAEVIEGTDWRAKGLPADLSLRIALHAGPVYEFTDPVTGRLNYMGSHVNRGARMEPVTPPGQVYASEAFAALATGERITDFTCEYVGQTPLAKGYGTFPTFHVRRRSR